MSNFRSAHFSHNVFIVGKLDLFGHKIICPPVLNQTQCLLSEGLKWNEDKGTAPARLHSFANGDSTKIQKQLAELVSKSRSGSSEKPSKSPHAKTD